MKKNNFFSCNPFSHIFWETFSDEMSQCKHVNSIYSLSGKIGHLSSINHAAHMYSEMVSLMISLIDNLSPISLQNLRKRSNQLARKLSNQLARERVARAAETSEEESTTDTRKYFDSLSKWHKLIYFFFCSNY